MDPTSERSHTIALIRVLIEDVMAARHRLLSKDSQTARRDVVRASVAAMEGLIWITREHVRDALDRIEELTPTADMAMREQTYIVAENGKINVQWRSVPLPTSLRMTVSQASILSPEMANAVDFSGSGWADFKQAISIRNRITHPKPHSGLDIGDIDLLKVASGLSWLMATTDYVMGSTNLGLTIRSEQLKDIVKRLNAGDEEALAEYHSALSQIENGT